VVVGATMKLEEEEVVEEMVMKQMEEEVVGARNH
jgi:hypothetical protein